MSGVSASSRIRADEMNEPRLILVAGDVADTFTLEERLLNPLLLHTTQHHHTPASAASSLVVNPLLLHTTQHHHTHQYQQPHH